MAAYDEQALERKLNMLNDRIISVAKRGSVFGEGVIAGNAFIISNGQERSEALLLEAVASAAEEIKQYVIQIWNDNEKRELLLEKLQGELNANIRLIQQERERLNRYLAQKKGVLEKEKGVEESIRMVLQKLQETENALKEVYDIYRQAKKKGWKIVFHPRLASQAAKYKLQNKDRILEERKREYSVHYKELFSEQQEYMRQEKALDDNIKNSLQKIAEAETLLIIQKKELGQLKDMVVKATNAFIYYNLLGEKIKSTGDCIVRKRDLYKESEQVSVAQKELENLLTLWEQNKNDSEAVYRILQEMFRADVQEHTISKIGKEYQDE